jgi:hypothetical protein
MRQRKDRMSSSLKLLAQRGADKRKLVSIWDLDARGQDLLSNGIASPMCFLSDHPACPAEAFGEGG